MENENLDTTNKLIKPGDISPSDDAIIRQLSDNLQDITTEDVDAICDEIDEAEKAKEWKITQELIDYRNTWIKRTYMKDDEIKMNIIKAVEKIPVIVNIDKEDGSRLIEFKLGGKKWKILDSKLETHTEEEYKQRVRDEKIDQFCVKLGGMRGDDKSRWKNKKLAEYVEQKEQEGLHIPKVEEMKNLLGELGKQINLNETDNQIAMLMYLTGMNGIYRLTMGDALKSGSRNTRTQLYSSLAYGHCFSCDYDSDDRAGLCMISHE